MNNPDYVMWSIVGIREATLTVYRICKVNIKQNNFGKNRFVKKIYLDAGFIIGSIGENMQFPHLK